MAAPASFTRQSDDQRLIPRIRGASFKANIDPIQMVCAVTKTNRTMLFTASQLHFLSASEASEPAFGTRTEHHTRTPKSVGSILTTFTYMYQLKSGTYELVVWQRKWTRKELILCNGRSLSKFVLKIGSTRDGSGSPCLLLGSFLFSPWDHSVS